MKKTLIISAILILFVSCSNKSLYTWGKYEQTSYSYLKNTNEKSTQKLIEMYKKIIEKQKGLRGVVPPGIYADYGFILLQAQQTEEGKSMLLKEITLYPESKIFIDRILKMIEK